MKRAKRIRSHYIPQCILRRFADDNGKLHVYDRSRPEQGCYTTGPNNLFVEKGLYRLSERFSAADRNRLEKQTSEFEAGLDDVVRQAEDALREGKIPRLREDAPNREYLTRYFLFCRARTPQMKEELAKQAPSTPEAAAQNYESATGAAMTPEDRERFIIEFNREEGEQDSYIWFLWSLLSGEVKAPKTEKEMAQKDLRRARVAGRSALVIGDAAYAVCCPGPESVVFLPVSSSLAFAWGAFGGLWNLTITRNEVRKINEIMFRDSERIASRAASLTKSLARIG